MFADSCRISLLFDLFLLVSRYIRMLFIAGSVDGHSWQLASLTSSVKVLLSFSGAFTTDVFVRNHGVC